VTVADLTALFGEIVDADDIDAQDNFFDIGGNSILALTLISEVDSRWGLKISLIDLVRNPSPERIMHLLAESAPNHLGSSASHPARRELSG
jgi:aryl carrier-like protein